MTVVCQPRSQRLFYENNQQIRRQHMPNSRANLRAVPSIDQLLRSDTGIKLRHRVGAARVTTLAREVTDVIRARIESGALGNGSKSELLAEGIRLMEETAELEGASAVRRVINATGVIFECCGLLHSRVRPCLG